ncbi:methoprene-tolerant isoform 1-T2 [Cochliomyia hominivorax]
MTTMPTQTLVQPIKISVKNMANTQNIETSPSTSPNTPTPPPSAPQNLVPTPIVSPSDTDTASMVINGREARNLAEKHRRDKLNASIGELAKMVPHVADSPRRLDKTAILRLATHGLRLQYVFGKSASRRKTLPKGNSHGMTNTLLHLLDSFFITLTCHGQIVLVSPSVEHLLGHCQSDLYGQNLLQITHPEDQEMLRQQLIPSDIESLFMDYHNSTRTSTTSSPSYSQEQQHNRSYSTSHSRQPNENDHNHHHLENDENYLAEIDEKLRTDKRCFTVRLARASTRSESKKIYEIVKIDGCFRRSDFSALATGSCSYPIVSQLIRRSRNNSSSSMCGGGNNGMISGAGGVFIPHLLQHDAIAQAALHGVSGNDIVLVAMARIIRPPKLMNYSLEANRLEYKTRHLIDGRIVDCDNRIGLVAGYLKEEVKNLSPFSFMHQDDVRWVIVALRQMYDCNSDYGESCYRLLSRNGNFIYLNTKGYLEIDKGTNKVHSFVCVNTLLDEEEGKRKVQEMKNKFSIIINAKVPTNSMQDVPASQNPQQLERIVLYLIENLQKRQTNACVVDEIHTEDDVKRHTSTPPLALVPPETASVKNSISKSVSVVIATAAKSFAVQNNINTNCKTSNQNTNNNGDYETTDLITKMNEQNISNTSTTQTAVCVQTTQGETILQRPSVLKIRDKSCRDSTLGLSTNSPDSIDNNAQHVSVLKRIRIDTSSTTALKDDEYHTPQPAKRTLSNSSTTSSTSSSLNSTPVSTSPTSFSLTNSCLLSPTKNEKIDNEAGDIHDFISSSLRHVGESLNCIDAQTSNLRQQCSSLPTCLDNKLDAIIIEHKKQNEFLVNIKNEYEVYKEQFPNSMKYTMQPHQQQQQQIRQNQKKHQQQQLSSPDIL